MTTTVTTHSTSVRVSMIGNLSAHASDTSCDSAIMSPQASKSLPASPVSVTSMSGLLNSRNLDEKLVVATLATLDSGNPSNLIKQDLKWIIQSRRKAEGKAELQVEFKKPVKDEQLTSEELTKRARRRELNRLAARRSREKGQKRKDLLVEEIRKLQSQNSELITILGGLTEQRNSIIETLRQHMKQCSDYQATQNAAVGMSQRVLEMLGFPSSSLQHEIPGVSSLYISTADHSSTSPCSQSPSLIIKEEECSSYSSCPSSPLIVGLSGKLIKVDDSLSRAACKSVVKIEDSPPILSGHLVQSTVVSPPSVSFPKPASSHVQHFDPSLLPAPRTFVSNHHRTSHNVGPLSSSFPLDESTDEEEFTQYKHKLMKHRKQSSSDFTHPSLSSSFRPYRVALERSFSFPCSTSESRSTVDLQSINTSVMTRSDMSSIYEAYGSLASPSSSETGSKADPLDSPLDLVVKNRSSSVIDEDFERQFRIGPTDTWPPAGTRTGATRPGALSGALERRRSVDDHHQSPPQPLNLSKESLVDDDVTLSHTSSCSNSPHHYARSASKYSGYTIDPYS